MSSDWNPYYLWEQNFVKFFSQDYFFKSSNWKLPVLEKSGEVLKNAYLGSKWLIWAYLWTPFTGITRKRIRSQKELVLLLFNTYDFDALCLKISLGSSIVKHKWWFRHSLRKQQSGSWQSIRPSEEVNKINLQCYKNFSKKL